MSLRTRIVALVGLVLLLSVLSGAAVAGFEARRTLQAELEAALVGGVQTARGVFEDLPRSDHRARDLAQLVSTFDGSRHLRAVLLDGQGRTIAASRLVERFRHAPAWFVAMLGPEPAAVTLPAPRAADGPLWLRLEPTSGPDVGALWGEFSGVVAMLGLGAALGLGLVYVALDTALRPLRHLAEAFERIGRGDYSDRLREAGASELAALERAFNAMAERLNAMNTLNRALENQLATIQEEERADLARDLHDEIGPQLLSVNIDAQIIGDLVGSARQAEVPDRVRSIQAAVVHMQRLVRDILGRLRPTRATEFGLGPAVSELVEFWRARRPEVAVELALAAEAEIGDALKDVVYRVIQEGLNNAMRHGQASRVRIEAAARDGVLTVTIGDDGAHRAANPEGGFGLIGMRERVRAAGGALAIDPGDGETGGWTLTASLPLSPAAAAAGAAA